MAIPRLSEDLSFPDPERAHATGVVAVGGDLSVERLLVAYSMGIFPWPAEQDWLLWHAPAERFVLAPKHLRINRTLAKALRKHPYAISLDTDFPAVIRACSVTPRPGQDGTWIYPAMIEAYTQLHRLGFAHSVEARRDGQLVGGLYGVSLGRAFFGESMFSHEGNASKAAFATLVAQLARWDFHFVDAQVHTPLLESFGAMHVPRQVFTHMVRAAVSLPGVAAPWRLDADLQVGFAPPPGSSGG